MSSITVFLLLTGSVFSNMYKIVPIDSVSNFDSEFVVSKISINNGEFRANCEDSVLFKDVLNIRKINAHIRSNCEYTTIVGFQDVRNFDWRVRIAEKMLNFYRTDRSSERQNSDSKNVGFALSKRDINQIEFKLPLGSAPGDSIAKYNSAFRSCFDIKRDHIYKILGMNKNGEHFTSYASRNSAEASKNGFRLKYFEIQNRWKICFRGAFKFYFYPEPKDQLDSVIIESSKRRDSLMQNCHLDADTTLIEARTSIPFSDIYFDELRLQIQAELSNRTIDSIIIPLNKNLRFTVDEQDSNLYILKSKSSDPRSDELSAYRVINRCYPEEFQDENSCLIIKHPIRKRWKLSVMDYYNNIKVLPF